MMTGRLLVLSLVFVAPVAAAPLRPVQLAYERGEAVGCPDAASVKSAVVERLGFDPFDDHAPARLSVEVVALASGYEARVTLVDESGSARRRVLTGGRPDCGDLATTLPFALSVAIEAFAAVPPPARLGPTAEPRVGPPSVPPPPMPDPVVPWRAWGTGGAFAAFGAAPTVAPGVGVGLGLTHGAFALSLEGIGVLPASLAVETGRIEVSSLALRGVPCFRWRGLRGCGVVGFGVLWSRAVDLAAATSAQTPLVSLGGRLAWQWAVLPWLGLVVFGEVLGALARTGLNVGPTEVWVTPPVAANVGLAFEVGPGVRPEP